MKPLLIALTLLASVFTKSSFANDEKITPAVLNAFQKTFSAAKEVQWTETNNMYKAQFELSGQVVNAYYDQDGTMLAVVRNITSLQLPVALQASIKKDHADYWITELFELTNDSGTSYYVTLESADAKVVLRSSSSTNWSTYQKSKKD